MKTSPKEPERARPFIVLKTFPGAKSGTTMNYHELVKCPDCGEEFLRAISSGCFHHNVSPLNCPKCNYPFSYYQRLRDNYYSKRQEEDWNPSER